MKALVDIKNYYTNCVEIEVEKMDYKELRNMPIGAQVYVKHQRRLYLGTIKQKHGCRDTQPNSVEISLKACPFVTTIYIREEVPTEVFKIAI